MDAQGGESAEQKMREFVDSVLVDKRYQTLSPAAFDQLRQEMMSELKSQIDRAVINELSEDQAQQFSALLDSPETTEQVLQDFIINSGVDTEQVVARTMLKFREFYLGSE